MDISESCSRSTTIAPIYSRMVPMILISPRAAEPEGDEALTERC
jgi:hypothetical protein